MRPARRFARTSCVTSCVDVLRGHLAQTCFCTGIGPPRGPCADVLRGRLAQGLAQPFFLTTFGFTLHRSCAACALYFLGLHFYPLNIVSIYPSIYLSIYLSSPIHPIQGRFFLSLTGATAQDREPPAGGVHFPQGRHGGQHVHRVHGVSRHHSR